MHSAKATENMASARPIEHKRMYELVNDVRGTGRRLPCVELG